MARTDNSGRWAVHLWDPDPPASWGAELISLAEHRDDPSLLEQVRRRLALASARQIDEAIQAALQRHGLSLPDAQPRLTRQVHGLRCTVFLDGQPLVELDPPRIDRSADGRTVTVTITSRATSPDQTPPSCACE